MTGDTEIGYDDKTKSFVEVPTPENFADAPVTLGEIRSDKNNNGADWTPRDSLIALLRQIDRGEVNVVGLVMAYQTDKGSWTGWSAAGFPGVAEAVGALEMAKLKIAGQTILAAATRNE